MEPLAMMRTQRRWALAVVVSVGFAARLHEFLLNRSLSWYEAALATDILHRPVRHLIGPLDNHEAAPFGFLLASRAAVSVFGDGERALRLVPLVCGLAALPLLYLVAKRYVTPWLAIGGVALVAVSPSHILWANTVKAYSMDLAVALVLLLCIPDALASTRRRAAVAMTAGALAIWCSMPACFVLAGIGVASIAEAVRARRLRWRDAIAGTAWAVSFTAYYVVSLRYSEADPYLRNLWSEYFLSVRDPQHTRWLLALTFVDPLHIVESSAWPVVPIILAGIAAMRRMPAQRVIEVVATLACVVVASCLNLYPWADRMILFATPILVIVLVAGAGQIGQWMGRSRPVIAAAVATAIAAALCARSLKWTWTPINRWDEIRPLVAFIADNVRLGDRVFAGEYGAVYDYYRGRFGLGGVPSTTGPYFDDEQGSYRCENAPELGSARRWWVLTDRADVRACLVPLGAPALVKSSEDSALYLYAR
jgi:uncharacterized membrane protein